MQAQITSHIREYVIDTWLSGDRRDFDDDTELQQCGVLDSFSTLALVAFVEDTYELRLEPMDVNAETFRTVRKIAQLIASHLARKCVPATTG